MGWAAAFISTGGSAAPAGGASDFGDPSEDVCKLFFGVYVVEARTYDQGVSWLGTAIRGRNDQERCRASGRAAPSAGVAVDKSGRSGHHCIAS